MASKGSKAVAVLLCVAAMVAFLEAVYIGATKQVVLGRTTVTVTTVSEIARFVGEYGGQFAVYIFGVFFLFIIGFWCWSQETF